MRDSNKSNKRLMVDKYTIMSVISILGLLLVWQLLVYYAIIPESVFPMPTQVFATFIEKLSSPNPDGSLLQYNILVSLSIASLGLLTAIVIGVPLGLLMGWYKEIDRLVRPLFEMIRPIPPISWIPLTILWVGIGMNAKVMIIFFASFIPCVLNSYTGIRSTSQTLINVAKTYGASNFQIFLKVGVPSAMPMAFAGIRIALGYAWSSLVAAELLSANAGLGYMISMGRQFGRPDIIVLGMLCIGVLGFVFTYIFKKIEKRIVRWRSI